MSDVNKTYLCGGVLFFMLMKATYPDGSAKDHLDGVKDGHKAPDVMSDLIYTFTGSRSFGSGKDTSNYRECKIEGTVNVPFNDETYINSYEDTVKFRYSEALKRMCEFSHWHINPAMKEWLVKALLEIVENDDEIDNNDNFYVMSDGSFMNKVGIRKKNEYEFEAFLVGVLLYILKNRCNKNYFGIDTLNFYGDKKPYKEREHKGNAGKSIERNIIVTLSSIPEDDYVSSLEEEYEDNVGNEHSYENTNNGTGNPEYEEPPEFENEDKKFTIIQHQTNVIQHGENNINLTNNGVMNFDFGGGKK